MRFNAFPFRQTNCPRCSLVGIWLPDEVNVLAARQDSRPRRLMAADPDGVPLYVTEPGSVVGSGSIAARNRWDSLPGCMCA